MILPGLIDAHVHLRVPGGEYKEDYKTGTAAALAGGFTTILGMPNTNPPLVTLKEWEISNKAAQSHALCDVYLYAGASEQHLDALKQLSTHAIGLKIYMDQTYGPLRVQGLDVLLAVFETWPKNKPICVHAENESVAIAIGLAASYRRHVHLCHVSRREEIEMIAKAKAEGVQITCEVTPHHLFLDESDAARLGAYGDIRPILQPRSDVEALWKHINTTVDIIASDHAPHTHADKEPAEPGKTSPPGIPGLESTLPLMLTAAAERRLSYERLVDLLYTNPRKIFNLPLQADTCVEVDEKYAYQFPTVPLNTKCGWSPYEGRKMIGCVKRVVLRGHEMVSDGIVTGFSH